MNHKEFTVFPKRIKFPYEIKRFPNRYVSILSGFLYEVENALFIDHVPSFRLSVCLRPSAGGQSSVRFS